MPAMRSSPCVHNSGLGRSDPARGFGAATMERMTESADELRRRGLELQAALPEPLGWGSGLLRRRKDRSEGGELVEGSADLVISGGLWGLLLAVPGILMYLLRRNRRSRP